MPSVTTLQKYLKGAQFPADRDDLLLVAEGNDAPEDVVEAIETLDEITFDGADEVIEALEE